MELLIAASLLGLASVALVALAGRTGRSRELALERLLRGGPGQGAARPAAARGAAGWRELLARWVSPLAQAAEREAYAPLRGRLAEAGLRGPSVVTLYMATRFALAIALAVAALPLAVLLLEPSSWLFAGVSAGALGFVAPGIFVGMRRRQRNQAIFRGLPDALDLMVVCVEAGLGLAATLQRVANEFRISSPLLSAELELVVLETQAGKSLTGALRALGERTGVADLQSLVSALVQTERLGTSIADTMRVQSGSIRIKRLRVAEEIAQKAPVKMLFPALLIFAAMLVMTIMPAALSLLSAFAQ
jgi:tight adherence protein C